MTVTKRDGIIVAGIFMFFYVISVSGLFCRDLFGAEVDIKNLKIWVVCYKQEDVEFFNKFLDRDDVIFTFGPKVKILKEVKRPKIAISRQSVSDFEKDLNLVKDLHLDFLNYNPEKWSVSHTPKEELDDIPGAVKKMKMFADKRGAKLCFVPDHVILERWISEVVPMVDFCGIQIQRYQGQPLEEFRRDVIKKVDLVRNVDSNIPIILQLSLAPPVWKTVIDKAGQEARVQIKDEAGKKALQPLQVQDILRQIDAIKDLTSAVAFIYTDDTRDQMKAVISSLRQKKRQK